MINAYITIDHFSWIDFNTTYFRVEAMRAIDFLNVTAQHLRSP